MKRLISYTLIFLLLSCQKENNEYQSENDALNLVDIEFTSSVSTRTSLSGQSVIWESSDKVSVFDGVGNRRFAVQTDENMAVIRGKAAEVETYCLLYPYYENATYGSDLISTLLPQIQRPRKDGFDAKANILAFVTEDRSVTMSNVCGLLRFSIEGDDVSAVSLTSVGGEKFVGQVKVDVSDPEHPSVISAGNDCIRVLPDEGKVFLFLAFTGEGEQVALREQELAFGQEADADLGAGEVLHDGEGTADILFHFTDGSDDLAEELGVAMGEVQAKNGNAVFGELSDLLGFASGGADSGNDLGTHNDSLK